MSTRILSLAIFLAATFATPASKTATAQTPAKTNLSVEWIYIQTVFAVSERQSLKDVFKFIE